MQIKELVKENRDYVISLRRHFHQYPELSMEEQQEARERQRMQSYYSRTASDLQRLVEAECDRMDYRGSMMYDEFPDRLMMEHTCRNIARQYGRENGGKDEKTAEEELLDLIGVLFYNEMFRRRSRRKHYYNLWL